MFFEQREKAQHLIKSSQDLAKLSAKLRGLHVKNQSFEGVMVCLGPKIQHMQDDSHKIDSAVQNLGSKSWSQIVAQQPQPSIPTRGLCCNI